VSKLNSGTDFLYNCNLDLWQQDIKNKLKAALVFYYFFSNALNNVVYFYRGWCIFPHYNVLAGESTVLLFKGAMK
jgi:hypothetical protein